MAVLNAQIWGEPGGPTRCLPARGHGTLGPLQGARRRLADKRLIAARPPRPRPLDLGGALGVESHVDDLCETARQPRCRRGDLGRSQLRRAARRDLAAQQPDRVERAILLDPAMHVEPAARERARGRAARRRLVLLARRGDRYAARDGSLFTTPRSTCSRRKRRLHLELRRRRSPPVALLADCRDRRLERDGDRRTALARVRDARRRRRAVVDPRSRAQAAAPALAAGSWRPQRPLGRLRAGRRRDRRIRLRLEQRALARPHECRDRLVDGRVNPTAARGPRRHRSGRRSPLGGRRGGRARATVGRRRSSRRTPRRTRSDRRSGRPRRRRGRRRAPRCRRTRRRTTRPGRQHLPDRQVEERAGAAERDVAHELLPDESIDVVVGLDREARRAPELREPLDALRARTTPLAEANERHAVVVRVPRADERRAEAFRDADQHGLVAEHLGDDVRRAQAVLDRQHEGVGADAATARSWRPRGRPSPSSR